MKATSFNSITSVPAPKEWEQIPEIKAQYPQERGVEVALQKLMGMNICVWMIGWGGIWEKASDFFYVTE